MEGKWTPELLLINELANMDSYRMIIEASQASPGMKREAAMRVAQHASELAKVALKYVEHLDNG